MGTVDKKVNHSYYLFCDPTKYGKHYIVMGIMSEYGFISD